MKLENMVCNYEQAKRLNALGIFHGRSPFVYEDGGQLKINADCGHEVAWHYNNAVPAIGTAELGVALPEDCQWSWPFNGGQDWQCAMCETGNDGSIAKKNQYGKTEAEARAAMLILLIESGKVTAEEVNQRLLNN